MNTMNCTKDSLSPCVRLFVDLLLNENGEGGSSQSPILVQLDASQPTAKPSLQGNRSFASDPGGQQ